MLTICHFLNEIDISDIINATIVLIAILSLFISYKSIKLTKQIAENNARPILQIIDSFDHSNTYSSFIELGNFGTGVAVLKEIYFIQDSKSPNNFKKGLINLFDFPEEWWSDYWVFKNKNYYLRSGESIKLAAIEKQYIDKYINQIKGSHSYEDINEQYRHQKKGIVIKIKYEDVFGNTFPYSEQLK